MFLLRTQRIMRMVKRYGIDTQYMCCDPSLIKIRLNL